MINVSPTDGEAITVRQAAAALATPPASPISTNDRRSRHGALGIDTSGLTNGSDTARNERRTPSTHLRNLSAASATSIDSATPLLHDGPDKQLSPIDEDESGDRSPSSITNLRRPRALSLEAGRRASVVVIAGLQNGLDRNRGLMLIGAAQLAFALMNATVKIMTRDEEVRVPTWQLIFSRQAITWLCCYLTLRWQRIPDPCWGPKEVRGLLFLRGCAGCVGLFSAYTSIQYLSLSDVTVLSFLAPATTSIAAYYCLGEAYHLREAIAGLLSLFGTIFVAQPTFIFGQAASGEDGVTEEQRLMAVGISLFGVVGATTAYVTLRKIGTRANALQGVEYFAIGCTLMSVLMPFVLKDQPFVLPRKAIFWVYLAFIGVFGFIAQMAVGRALQISSVGRSLLGSFVQLPFSLIIQYYLFNEKMDFLSGIGSAIILSSTCWIVFGKDRDKSKGIDGVKEGVREPLLDAEAALPVHKSIGHVENTVHSSDRSSEDGRRQA